MSARLRWHLEESQQADVQWFWGRWRSRGQVNTTERIRKEIDGLVAEAVLLIASFSDDRRKELEKQLGTSVEKLDFKSKYQHWYTKASATVRDLLPTRLADFQALYQLPKRRRTDLETYGIADYLAGYTLVGYSSVNVVQAKFYQQYQILQACREKLGLGSRFLL